MTRREKNDVKKNSKRKGAFVIGESLDRRIVQLSHNDAQFVASECGTRTVKTNNDFFRHEYEIKFTEPTPRMNELESEEFERYWQRNGNYGKLVSR